MIPDEAVEAAASAALGRYLSKATIQLILEAAAPHMLAQGWDEGWYVHDHYVHNRHQGLQRPDNPYRSQDD